MAKLDEIQSNLYLFRIELGDQSSATKGYSSSKICLYIPVLSILKLHQEFGSVSGVVA